VLARALKQKISSYHQICIIHLLWKLLKKWKFEEEKRIPVIYKKEILIFVLFWPSHHSIQ